MKRDMELIRKILFSIENEHVDIALMGLNIPGYDFKTVAYHCKQLYEANMVSSYDSQFAGDGLYCFSVGGLTWEGNEFLDKIRSDTIWNDTKKLALDQGLPLIISVINNVASAIIAGLTKGIMS
jgi:hypothetical protein